MICCNTCDRVICKEHYPALVNGNPMLKNMDTVIFKCPACHLDYKTRRKDGGEPYRVRGD